MAEPSVEFDWASVERDLGEEEFEERVQREVSRRCTEMLAAIIQIVLASPHPHRTVHQISWAVGLNNIAGASTQKLAAQHGISRAAFHREAQQIAGRLGLPKASYRDYESLPPSNGSAFRAQPSKVGTGR